jgi:hypothetical protein
MLEILFIIFLAKKIGAKVRDKGRTAGGYQALLVLLWVGGEITGFILGFSMGMENGAYLLALMGAATGAVIAWIVASAVKPLNQPMYGHQVGNVFD